MSVERKGGKKKKESKGKEKVDFEWGKLKNLQKSRGLFMLNG